jgi:CheY-like chemotaxis protein
VSGDNYTWYSPLAGATVRAAAPTLSIEVSGEKLPPLRILIADDYPDAADSLALIFTGLGQETQVARDGEEALAQAEQWHPDVCVLDLEMPKIDGLEAARRIRAQRGDPRPLLIAFSGWTDSEHKQSALRAGFDQYVVKPVEPAKLMRIIRTFQRTRYR